MNTCNSLTLPDGRKLAYAEFGQPVGAPNSRMHLTAAPLAAGDMER